MSEGKKKKDQKRFDSNSSLLNMKKEKKKIRFKISDTKINEEDSSPAPESSHHLIKEDQSECLITQKEVNVTVLKKYIYDNPKSTVPRPVFAIPCSNQFSEKNKSNVFFSSSLQSIKSIPDNNMQLLEATSLGKLKAVKEAIFNGADVNAVINNQTPLLIAVDSGNARLVSYLLKVPKINLNLPDNFGRTPLLLALGQGKEAIVKILLRHKADVNLADNLGRTPLHHALFYQYENLVKLFLAFGADFERSDSFGEKPMYTASVKKPNLQLLKALLKIGAKPDYQTISGISLLSRTILNGTDFEIIETLVRYGASVNSQDIISKKTPLHFAALMDNIKVAELLVNVGADINLKTTYNFTPLDEAYFQKSLNVTDFLASIKRFRPMF